MTKSKQYITLIIVAVAFLIRFIRLDVPHAWSFDEVYHALSAEAYALNDPRGYEWWNASPKDLAWEWLHPPLGKLFMATSIKLFATPYIPESKEAPLTAATTFAWRFPGVIFAALTVWLLIRFGDKVFKNYWVGAIAGFLYALDGLSFVQSRTGMNDIYVTFFIVLVFYRLYIFLIEYPHHVVKNLAWVGLASGLAASTKWSGFYAVAIAFTWGVGFLLKKRAWKKIPLGFLYLALLPVCVYILSYGQWWLQGHSVNKFIELHQQIWWYQTGLKATHDYQSKAYTWPILLRPVWYYVKYDDHFDVQGNKELWIGNIYTMGNPLIWWAGVGAIGYLLTILVQKYIVAFILKSSGKGERAEIKTFIHDLFASGKSNNLGFLILLVGYFGMFLPWVASPRIMFLYHYLPSVPFLCLALAYCLVRVAHDRQGKYLVYAYLLLVALAFIYFYPHWTGWVLPQKWVNTYYWLKSWK
ncbi:phospholipid carrier-dependent glycosyltransferase [Candidatus Microgenomates bacterium]|nr:MAG: phospholipid carrier-dependent glycosyltransferase [Candidatus Microgenomates bacterium]